MEAVARVVLTQTGVREEADGARAERAGRRVGAVAPKALGAASKAAAAAEAVAAAAERDQVLRGRLQKALPARKSLVFCSQVCACVCVAARRHGPRRRGSTAAPHIASSGFVCVRVVVSGCAGR